MLVGLTLGKIVKADSHTHYVCQIYGKNEVKAGDVPQPRDYVLGTFVSVQMGGQESLIGLVYDTILLNPEFANLGPRLSPERELQIFAPDYLNERAVLVGIITIGYVDADGAVHQGVPRFAANSDSEVEVMSPAQVRYFHKEKTGLRLAYLPVLMQENNPVMAHLTRFVLDGLAELLPDCKVELDVLADDILWRTQIGPLGGVR
jgi:hypothetical protein